MDGAMNEHYIHFHIQLHPAYSLVTGHSSARFSESVRSLQAVINVHFTLAHPVLHYAGIYE